MKNLAWNIKLTCIWITFQARQSNLIAHPFFDSHDLLICNEI
jgi:hypothetical protein